MENETMQTSEADRPCLPALPVQLPAVSRCKPYKFTHPGQKPGLSFVTGVTT